MKLLLSSLQLASLCALSSYSVSSLNITQSEDVIVTEGDTANISCCWKNVDGRTRVIWMKNERNIQNDLLNATSNVQSKCSFLTIANITMEHSGTYICTVFVEIPFFKHVSGNGTTITVTSKSEKEEKKKKALHDEENQPWSSTAITLISLGVAALILLIILACFCCLRRRRGQAVRVIYEAPHFDSETQEMDKNSTGSRGSSQWCQVPVYESCDYFEQVQAKKSG